MSRHTRAKPYWRISTRIDCTDESSALQRDCQLKQRLFAWEQQRADTLTLPQKYALQTIGDLYGPENIRESIQTLEPRDKDGKEVKDPFADETKLRWLEDAAADYDGAILKAISLGLHDHPLVVHHIVVRRAVGNKEFIQTARRRMRYRQGQVHTQHGEQTLSTRAVQGRVRPPIGADKDIGEEGDKEVELLYELMWEIIQRQAQGEPLRSIYKGLTEQKRIRGGYENFRKWVHRHRLYFRPVPPSPWYVPSEVWDELAPLINQYDPPKATGRLALTRVLL